MFDDREAKSEATVRACRRRVRLFEALKYVGEELQSDAATCVDDLDFGSRVDPREAHADHATSIGELHGVRKQIPNNLLQAAGVTHRTARIVIECDMDLDTLRICRQPHRVQRGLDDRCKIYGTGF